MADPVLVLGLRTEQQVQRIARELAARRGGTRVHLDMSPLDREGASGRHVRISSTWATVLSNLVLGHLGATPLHVTLPSQPGVVLQLARAGLMFAVAQHNDCVIDTRDASDPPDLDRWRDDWHPANPAQSSFFDSLAWDPPQELEPRFLAFLNPDRSPMSTADADRTNAIAPWLRSLSRQVMSDSVRRDHLLGDVSMAANELAENIVFHAKLVDRDSCYVFVYATKGPAGDSANRLWIVAHDTGIGMDATLGPLFEEEPDAASRVASPFNLQMRRYGRDRGKGLARVIAMARARGGAAVFAATSLAAPERGAVVLNGQQRGDCAPHVSSDLPVQGTIVSVSFRLSFPSGRRSEVRHAQREAANLRGTQLELLGSD